MIKINYSFDLMYVFGKWEMVVINYCIMYIGIYFVVNIIKGFVVVKM